jgi:hypothetical protein
MIHFIVRHAGFFLSLGIYLALWILLPDVDLWRRSAATFVFAVTIMVAIAGWEYED